MTRRFRIFSMNVDDFNFIGKKHSRPRHHYHDLVIVILFRFPSQVVTFSYFSLRGIKGEVQRSVSKAQDPQS